MKTILDAWSPETSHDREAVLQELECVLASPQFCNSKRYPALLRYIVEHALEGKADSLKERTLGVEVFHRPADYDTNADTVVRYTAGEVRKRLSLYYHQHSAAAGVQISLPVGSYAPEFLKEHESEPPPVAVALSTTISPAFVEQAPQFGVHKAPPSELRPARKSSALWMLAGVVAVIVVFCGGLAWRAAARSRSALNQFWGPALTEQGEPLMCVGGNVFQEKNFSGTMTAGKDIEYPFVSMQLAAGMARVGGLLERNGAHYHLQASASTPLNDLRDRPLILMGGYNNAWTMRLMQPLRFHFPFEPQEGIVDKAKPNRMWARDRTQPYSSADDYGLVARFRDTTTGSTVFVLAGLGRNGTEAAAQFATNPNSMQMVKDRVGAAFGSGNVEVVLKISVIDGKTGSPSIEDVYAW